MHSIEKTFHMTRVSGNLWARVALLLACVLVIGVGHARADPGKASCEALKSATLFAGVQDAPTSVISATYIDADGARPAYCALVGYVTPAVGMAIWMPTTWNGKLLGRGCGGFCGVVAGEFACKDPIRIGYACVMTDMGHTSTLIDGVWADHNLQGKFDFGSRSTHLSTVAAKAILASYYGRPSQLNYFLGCSTGGRQALMEAERFPADYQGIVSVAPALNESGASIQLTWSVLANRAGGHNILPQSKLAMLHAAVVAQCDMDDGLKDGLIGDPRLCRFDPARLTCRGADGPDCLTPAQVAVVRKIYAGPHNAEGLPFFTGGAPVGSEGHWAQSYIGEGDKLGDTAGIITDFWRYLGLPEGTGPGWTLDHFDFEHDPDRAALMETLYNAGDPDLRAFKALGGKLLLAHGMADDNVVTGGSIDFYQGVTRFMGGPDQTTPFMRLFLVPGMNHCTGGDGPYAIDYLGALDGWRKRNAAPTVLAAAHPKDGVDIPYLGVGLHLDPSQVAFRRPVFAWPATAHYRSGDPNDAASWAAR